MDANEFIDYLQELNEERWQVKIDDTKTVKNVIAHLVGWERECAKTLPKVWDKKIMPWFMKTDDYNEFNQKNMYEFRELSADELLREWQKWQKVFNNEINKIGIGKIRKAKGFEWVLDEGNDSHYLEHFREIKESIGE